jgi:hypothetical protein
VATTLRWIFNAFVAWASPILILKLKLYGVFFFYAALLSLCFVYCAIMHKDANRIRLYTKYDNLVEEGAKDGTQDQSQIEEYMN